MADNCECRPERVDGGYVHEATCPVAAMTDVERVDGFLAGMAKLTEQYGLYLGGCGCCGSPYLATVDNLDQTVAERIEHHEHTGTYEYRPVPKTGCDVRTVADLIAELSQYPADLPVILAKDGEGNDYSPLFDATNGWYAAESPWSGERVDPREDLSTAVRAVFLWPTN